MSMQNVQETNARGAPVMRGLVRPVLVSSIFFMVVTGVAYPLATTGAAQVLFRKQAQGSLVERDGQAVGSAVLGQNFTKPEYFHPRPSMTVGADPADSSKTVDQPYNAASSAASNQGVLSKKLIDQVAARAEAYRKENGLAPEAPVPVDAVTASGSGLDPEISIANAKLQLQRVATARGVSADRISTLLDQQTSRRQLGVLGEPRVNVLQLNLALDAALEAQPTTPRPAAR
jgi:K+-transporting ATPase ATPase C chain